MTEIQTELTEAAQATITQAEAAYQKATELEIADDQQYDAAGGLISEMKRYKAALETERKELKAPILEAGRKIDGKFKPHLDMIDKAIKAANAKITTYYRECERKRLEAEAKAAEKARKEQERLRKREEAARQKGQEEKAAALAEQADHVDTAPIAPSAPKQTQETTIVETWHAEVYDLLSLVEAVAEGKASTEYLEPVMSALNATARAQKGTMSIPGVRAVKQESVRRK